MFARAVSESAALRGCGNVSPSGAKAPVIFGINLRKNAPKHRARRNRMYTGRRTYSGYGSFTSPRSAFPQALQPCPFKAGRFLGQKPNFRAAPSLRDFGRFLGTV